MHLKKILFINISLLVFILISFTENWVGKAATFQLNNGTLLADGSAYNNDILIAACNGFKLGAEVNVINPKNGKNVLVTIKDRVTNDKDYFILLTPKASSSIDLEWDTNLVIVEGKFADINSTERLEVNGLVKEGELDLETLKKFPEIKWPENEKVTTEKINIEYQAENTPNKETTANPVKKEQIAKLDTDEFNEYKIENENQNIEAPEKEQNSAPDSKMKQFMISEDLEENAPQKETTIKTEEIKKVINWEKKLLPGKEYIRISTAFDKKEGERRYTLFQMLFPNVIGLIENNKYIIFIGPIDYDQIDISLKKIKDYGFKDAYIVKGKN